MGRTKENEITDRDCFWFAYAFCRSFCGDTRQNCIAYCKMSSLSVETMGTFKIRDLLEYRKVRR